MFPYTDTSLDILIHNTEEHVDQLFVLSPEHSQEVRMIGDFEGSANALWAIYGKEAKSHDEARINTLKDDMDGVLIFVCQYQILPMTTHAYPSPDRLVYSLLLSPHSHSTANRT